MTTGKGLRLAVRMRRRSHAYCLGFDNQSRQISVRESSIVPDYVKELPAAGFHLPAKGARTCRLFASAFSRWKLGAGGWKRVPTEYPANGSFFVSTQHAVVACTFLLGKENYGQASRLISIG